MIQKSYYFLSTQKVQIDTSCVPGLLVTVDPDKVDGSRTLPYPRAEGVPNVRHRKPPLSGTARGFRSVRISGPRALPYMEGINTLIAEYVFSLSENHGLL